MQYHDEGYAVILCIGIWKPNAMQYHDEGYAVILCIGSEIFLRMMKTSWKEDENQVTLTSPTSPV